MPRTAPVVAITLGDPAGIGPEIIRAALASPRLPRGVRFEVIGSAAGARPGRPTTRTARAALAALETAVAGCLSGRFAGMATGPVCKEALAAVGFDFPGQTEFLAARCGLREEAVTMAMAGKHLRVFLLTTHVSLARAIRLATRARIARTLTHAREFLMGIGIAKPRLAIAALNPHAGEGGLFGTEEIRILRPALPALASRLGSWVKDVPVVSADTVFLKAAGGSFDGIICLYHDQGLIPFKLLEFDSGVNVTLGLPFPRTSPDHGTAFDIAGRRIARPDSMIAALQLAAKLARANRP